MNNCIFRIFVIVVPSIIIMHVHILIVIAIAIVIVYVLFFDIVL